MTAGVTGPAVTTVAARLPVRLRLAFLAGPMLSMIDRRW